MLVEVGGRRLEDRLPSRQGRLLFGFLVCARGRGVGREALIEALWPAQRPASAPATLNALVSKLRGAIEPLRVEGRSELRLALPGDATVDVELAREAIHRAESAVAAERWTDAWAPARVALHTTNRLFLAGLEGPWIDEQRRALEEIQVTALECVAATGLGIGGPELAAAERAGRRLTAIAPYRESGYRALIETLAREDNVAEALRVYERLRTLLREELGIAPSTATQELHKRLLERRPA